VDNFLFSFPFHSLSDLLANMTLTLLFLLISHSLSEETGELCNSSAKAKNFHGKEQSCDEFYSCQRVRGIKPRIERCPLGLFWNKEKLQCDFPDKSTCELSEKDLLRLKPLNTKYNLIKKHLYYFALGTFI